MSADSEADGTAAYRRLVAGGAGALRVRSPGLPAFLYTERHLQGVWYDAALRPRALRTADGEPVRVEHPGAWNMEEGPDFRGAVLRIGRARRLAGDVEVHVHPAGWRQHGHDRDPAYAGVVAHVTYFPGTPGAAGLPPGAVQIALKDALAANPFFSFESIDLTAYPYAARLPATPCARILAEWPPERVAGLLEAAGQERLRRKAARIARVMADKGPDQTLYEEVMTALGYKHNRQPFRYLAEHVPLDALRDAAAGDADAAYALLLGVAGLLPFQPMARWDAETRRFVRRLWDVWWKHQARWQARALPAGAWKTSGQRPHNHPRRRLMLAALLFAGRPVLETALAGLADGAPAGLPARLAALLQPECPCYWRFRLGFSGPPRPAPVALMGQARAAAVVSNALLPFLAAAGRADVLRPEVLRRLPAEEDNHILRRTAAHLLGPQADSRFDGTGLQQQGLIQIFHDFCLADRSRCGRCTLPRRLAAP